MSHLSSPQWRLGIVLTLVLTTMPRVTHAAVAETVSQSAGFRIEPATFDAAGAVAASAGSRLVGSMAQPAAVGASASPHFIVQSGVWGYLGSGVVPVVLSASRVPADAASIALAWSGNNASYDLYRATNCATVFGSVFATTAANAYTDGAAPTNGLTCYNVLAIAPGPAPPPPGATSP